MRKIAGLVLFLFMFISILPVTLQAQCPMCKATVESAMKNEGNAIGMGLNDGILYLLAAPYTIVVIIGFLWYRNYRKKQRQEMHANLG